MKLFLLLIPIISFANPITIIENKFIENIQNYSNYICGQNNIECERSINQKIQFKNIKYSHARIFKETNYKSVISFLYENDPEYLNSHFEKIFHFK